jgi:hypothetical protein
MSSKGNGNCNFNKDGTEEEELEEEDGDMEVPERRPTSPFINFRVSVTAKLLIILIALLAPPPPSTGPKLSRPCPRP